MDLVEDCGYHTIMTVMDCFSKMVVLVSLQSTDVDAVANAFFRHIISQHGLLLMITTDQDQQFMAKFW